MKTILIKFSLCIALVFFGSVSYGAERNIGSWNDLSQWYANAYSGDILNINNSITFEGILANTTGWERLTIRGWDGSKSVARTLNGNNKSGFSLTDKNLAFENISFSNFYKSSGYGVVINASASTVTFVGANVSFSNNSNGDSPGYGGAIYTSNSSISFIAGNVNFSNNSVSAFNSSTYGGAIHSSNSNIIFIDGNVNFSNNSTGYFYGYGGAIYMTGSSKLEFKAANTNINISFIGNKASSNSNNDIFYGSSDSQLIFNVATSRQIVIKNRILVSGNNSYGITKKIGTGDLIFEKGVQVSLTGTFSIDEGAVIMLSNNPQLYKLVVNNLASYSMINDEMGKTTIDNNAEISGEFAVDSNFTSETSDWIYVTGTLDILSGSILTINILGEGVVGHKVRIAQANSINYVGFNYESTLYNVYKDGNSLLVELLKLPPSAWDIFATLYQNTAEGSTMRLSKDITAKSNSLAFGAHTNNNISINGERHTIDSANFAGLFFNLTNKTISFNNLIFKNFKNSSSGGVFVANGNSIFDGVDFLNNTATVNGGAIIIDANSASISLNDVNFRNNKAGVNGGAIYMSNNTNVSINAINADILFSANKANENANDIYVNNASLTLNATDGRTITMNGGISGVGGSIIKTDKGNLIFGNDAIVNYQGAFTINAGSVAASNNVRINSFNIVSGAAYIADWANTTTVDQMTIDGDFKLFVNFNDNAKRGNIRVNNLLTINQASSRLLIENYGYGSGELVIVSTNSPSGSITGEFGSIVPILSGGNAKKIDFVPVYGSNEVKLIITATPFLAPTIPKLNNNQNEVALLFDRTPEGTKLDVFINSITKMVVDKHNFEQAKEALEQVSGVFFTNIVTYGAMSNNISDIYSRVNLNTIEETGKDPYEVWVAANLKGLKYESDEDFTEAFNSNGVGGQVGIDLFNNGDHFVGGLYAGIDLINFKQGSSKGNMKDISVGIYGASLGDSISLAGALSIGLQSFDTTRDLSFAGLMTQSNFNTYNARFGGEMKFITSFSEDINFIPFIGVQGGYVMIPEITETGGGIANLTIKGNSYLRMLGLAGLGFENKEGALHWYSKIYGGYVILGADKQKYEVSFSEGQEYGTMNIYGFEQSKIMFGGSLGIEFVLSNIFSIFTNGNVEIADKLFGYRVNAGINYKL